MLSIYNIWTVARYEVKTLLRSWFFRIFAGLIIFILFWLDFAFLTIGDVPLNFKGLAACVPYMNILFLNTAQAVICVFLASDFLKRDKKLDTTEVIYMRSMTNGDYVMGKTLGILMVFLALNVVVLLIGMVFNIISTDVAVKPLAYLWYPLLISVPTLVFILGLSFLSMALIGNQAVTFIILLGYIATTLFFFSTKFHHLLDYMAFYLPMMQSDFVGFGNVMEIVVHRGIYLLLGFAFIFATIRLLKRLPQSRVMHGSSGVISLVLAAAAVLLGAVYITDISVENRLREEMIALNNSHADAPHLTPVDYRIDLNHAGGRISCDAAVVFENRTDEPVTEYLFNLNPGLKLNGISRNSSPVNYEQELHLVRIRPETALTAGNSDSLIFSYSGVIEEAACYLDLDKDTRETDYRIWMYNIAKRHAFITPDYLLLTPEAGWYPRSGPTFSSEQPQKFIRDFAGYRLSVKTRPELTAVAQGAVSGSDGHYVFTPDVPLPQMSLSIGKYTQQSLEVDSVLYSLYTLQGHDYYRPYVDSLGDTLAAVIKNQRQNFENRIDMPFAYNRFTIVEVPVQFISYPRIWTKAGETVQPEIVYLAENGIGVDGADFKTSARRMQQWTRRSNQVVTPQEEQTRTFERFIRSTFLGEETGGRWGGDDAQASLTNDYTVYPHFYSYVNFLYSEEWPLLNTALESFISSRLDNPMRQMRRMWLGMSEEEKVNLALLENTMKELLKDPDYSDLQDDIIKAKGNYLFSQLIAEIGEREFPAFLNSLLNEFRYRKLTDTEFLAILHTRYGVDFRQKIEHWEQGRGLPGYLVSDLRGYSVLEGRRTRFQVRFTVSNPEPYPGIIKVQYRLGGRGGPGMMMGRGADEEPEYIISLDGGQSKEIGMVLDAQPRVLTINTMISQNIPIMITEMFEEFEINNRAELFEGERILEETPVFREPGVIIVDNEDENFDILDTAVESPLKKLLNISPKQEDAYAGIMSWRVPAKWTPTTHDNFYGTYVKSGVYIKPGDGSKKVVWKAPVSERGNYDIYCYYPNIRTRWGRGGGGGGGGSDNQGVYEYIIHHADGSDQALFDSGTAEEGWNFLGTYYLEADTAIVELSDKADSKKVRSIFADAVKWVKQ